LRATEIEYEFLDRSLVAAEEVALERCDEPLRQLVRTGLRVLSYDEVDVDLEIARADRGLDSISIAAGICKSLRHRRLAGTEEAKLTELGLAGAAEHTLQRFSLERHGPQAL
jgi:hypothetical protein